MSKFYKVTFFSAALVLCLLFSSGKVMAGIEPYENFLKGKILKNDSLIVKDEKFRNPSFNWNSITNISVKNNISLRIIDHAPIEKSFSCTVKIKILYFSDPSQLEPTEIDSVQLRVNYSKEQGAKYKIVDNYKFVNGYYVKIHVLDISSPEYGEDLPPVLQLTSSIVIDRQYQFVPEYPVRPDVALMQNGKESEKSSSSSSQTMSLMFNANLEVNSITNNQFRLSWTSVPGAEEYDVEWTTTDQSSDKQILLNNLLANNAVFSEEIDTTFFRNNATRVTIPGNNYLISLLYNADYLLIRIRAVQYNIEGIRVEGEWDYRYTDNGNDKYAIWEIDWHEQDLNWQSSVAYAEEGKKKEVVNYFDGTLRGRQTATINSSDQVAVVQENVYDEFGRTTASILPTPVKDSIAEIPYLRYFKNLNRNLANLPYNFSNVTGGAAGFCEFNPNPLNTSSGAAQYYSPNNPFKADQRYNSYIPDAEGFPLSITQYTPDNTNRIKLQGGVGHAFQPGKSSNSKITRYYYGKPEQWELDRLFGNDIGLANRYLKNMVMDPNGQISISYLNASGKTIATALTGNSPDSQDALISQPNKKSETSHILNPEQFVFNAGELKLSATTTYMSSVAGTASFTYDVEKLVKTHFDGAFCSKCYYDMEIKLMDDCNNIIYSVKRIIKNGSEDPACNPGVETGNFNIDSLGIGVYYLSFDFILNRDEIDKETEQYISSGQQHGGIRNEFSFILNELKQSDFSGLFSDCKTCKEMLGSPSFFKGKISEKLLALSVDSASLSADDFNIWVTSLYNQLEAQCTGLQQNCFTTPCDDYKKLMLEDVAPGGQYALFDGAGNVLEPELNVLLKYWAIEFPVAAPGSERYNSELITLEDGSTTSPYAADFFPSKVFTYWKEEWATKFLQYHPEICKLQFCEITSNYLSWEDKLKDWDRSVKLDSVSGTANLQYSASNPLWLLDADPFFKTNERGQLYYQSMKADLENYTKNVLKYQETILPIKSISQFVDYILYCSDKKNLTNSSSDPNTWTYCTPIESCRVPDREWQFYRDIYFQTKEKYYKQERDKYCGDICVIGTPYGLQASGLVSIHDFAISPASSSSACTEQEVSITYLTGSLKKAVTVEIYYPGQSMVTSVPFAIAESQKVVCIPGNIPVSSIKISSIQQ